MAASTQSLSSSELKRFGVCPVKCPMLAKRITSLADYLAILSETIRTEDIYWFRGNKSASYSLTPFALRYPLTKDREKALGLISAFKRIADIKLPRPPADTRELEWALIAQHHGLPTRLLDWTESATTALYFACEDLKTDAVVYVLNPVALNRLSYASKPRILDPQKDYNTILAYLRMSAKRSRGGRYPVAIYPVWNSDRLMMQKGVFTLHGSRFSLDEESDSTIVAIPILREAKAQLTVELQRIGVDELTLFPELEHSCSHLIRLAGLPSLRTE